MALCFAGVVCACCAPCAADDVYLQSPASGAPRPKVVGRIVDYNGRELVLDVSGVERRYPAAQVDEVVIDSTPMYAQAEELFAAGDYTGAAAKYEQALREETRRWEQRRIAARLIWCLRNTAQYRRAGEVFLALEGDDPAMLDFACLPVAWLPAPPAPDIDKKSREWVASDSPVAVLMGASHRLSTSDRELIVKRLEKLAGDKDPRIAATAKALLWEATYITATPTQLAAWSAEVEQFPVAARAGAYYALGRALAHHKRYEDAALNYLRVPIEYPLDRPLAASALFEAGRALEQAGAAADAARVYGELIADQPRSQPAGEAQRRLKEIEASAAGKVAG